MNKNTEKQENPTERILKPGDPIFIVNHRNSRGNTPMNSLYPGVTLPADITITQITAVSEDGTKVLGIQGAGETSTFLFASPDEEQVIAYIVERNLALIADRQEFIKKNPLPPTIEHPETDEEVLDPSTLKAEHFVTLQAQRTIRTIQANKFTDLETVRACLKQKLGTYKKAQRPPADHLGAKDTPQAVWEAIGV